MDRSRVKKVVSGGQTGVDRAALDAAMELQIPCGGFCPRGRLAEDGKIPEKYLLQETKTEVYEERTRKNVADSDGTLVFTRGQASGGTAYTIETALTSGKPVWIVDLEKPFSLQEIAEWMDRNFVRTLNVAGPRESGAPGIYEEAKAILKRILS
ncbi:MAG: putative molybdenum carrier protein [bacterium]